MAITPVAASSELHHHLISNKGGILAAVFLLPFLGAMRRSRLCGTRYLTLCILAIVSLIAVAGLSGCGSDSDSFGEPQQSCAITVMGTANGTGGATLQRSTKVVLTVQ